MPSGLFYLFIQAGPRPVFFIIMSLLLKLRFLIQQSRPWLGATFCGPRFVASDQGLHGLPVFHFFGR